MYKWLPVVDKAVHAVHASVPHHAIGLYGKLYDARAFEATHPGGAAMLAIVRGQDCTALFETHHVHIERARQRLKTIPCIGTYSVNHEFSFERYAEVRRRLRPWLTQPVRAVVHFERGTWVVVMVLLHLSLCIRPFASWAWLVTLVASAVVNTVCGGFGHDALHRLQPMAALLDWNGLSATEWILEHVSSHHMFTNLDFDHDVISMEPFIVWMPTRARGLVGVVGMHAVFLISELAVAFQGNFVHRVRWRILFDATFPLWMRLAPLAFPLRLLTLVWGHGLVAGVVTFVMCVALAGYMFALLAHLNHGPANYPQTPAAGKQDFVEHQLLATKDMSLVGFPLEALALGLDRQTLHHLFPTVDHSNLPAIRKELARILPELESALVHTSLRHLLSAIHTLVGDRRPRVRRSSPCTKQTKRHGDDDGAPGADARMSLER